ncbi:hypothetical protein [Bacillus subtilis]|uniref:hypothetical protein n=1 Tax=Bacillus subtilis TaxID=1423 RepID=UPI000AF844D4|nr:hypothetical protein [Bacillus subtilis]
MAAVYKETVDERKIHDLLSYFEKKNLHAYIEACAGVLPLFLKAAVTLNKPLRFIGKC